MVKHRFQSLSYLRRTSTSKTNQIEQAFAPTLMEAKESFDFEELFLPVWTDNPYLVACPKCTARKGKPQKIHRESRRQAWIAVPTGICDAI